MHEKNIDNFAKVPMKTKEEMLPIIDEVLFYSNVVKKYVNNLEKNLKKARDKEDSQYNRFCLYEDCRRILPEIEAASKSINERVSQFPQIYLPDEDTSLPESTRGVGQDVLRRMYERTQHHIQS